MRTTLILACLAATSIAAPAGPQTTCAVHCTDANQFSYETSKSYVYQYSVTTSTALLGTFDDDARMHITANAHIDVTAPCEYTLRLTEVTLDGSSHAEEFAAALTKSPLRFSFQDGRVESVCSEVSEPAWVLNIKRGVLSTFQNSMTHQVKEDVQESDISGVCVTHYKSLMEGNVMTVEKVKDLSSCTERPELAAYIASKPYDTDSPVQSLPIFKSTHKCNQRIEEGILKTAECEEIHKYRPFSSDEGGAVTTAKTTMSLVSMDGPALPVPGFEFIPKSLVFEQTAASKPEALIEAIEKILNDLDMAAHDEIRPEVPALFSTLVASLKDLDYPTLSTIYINTKDMHSRKFLLDAMPLVGTAASVGVVKDMVMSGDMTSAEADVWFTSLAFFKSPTSDMFTALVPLMDNPSQQAMLGTSALVNTYCKLHTDCGTDAGVQQVLRAIEAQIGTGCAVINEAEKMKVLVALKALRNAGHWVNATPILQRCYTEDNAMEVRVAAIEAWRHTPCEYDRSNLLAAFQDETQDSEVRIAAYLAVMTCPTPTVINTIKERLTSEGVNQVGSFIWTHLTNMQESAAPGKQWVREMIGEELLQKKFSTDDLKFSRNYESSFFMNELNAGATIESNVIFSRKSYLPRSAMLDLTLDLFGESINLFEVGGRIEGFETYVERFFGSNGYFPEETVEGMIRNMRQAKTDAEATTLEGILDKVADEPEGSYYLRVFGNELYYNHFHGSEELTKNTRASNPLDVLMDLAREGEVDYTKSHQLIDTHYSIPTLSGLPLTLTAQGTATFALRMNGNFEAENLRNITIEGHFHPSAAVQIDGLMVVDAHVTRTGLKISSTLHTSTFLDGKVQIDGGKLVDIALQTPRERVEIIDVSTKFFYLTDDQEIQKEVENQVVYDGCRGIAGVELCTGLSYTPSSSSSPIFPYTGPFAAHIHLKKTDSQTGYVLRFTREESEIAFLFDTPESQVDHKVSLAIASSEEGITVDLHTPLASGQGVAEYAWEENDKSLKVQLIMERNETYTLETRLKTHEEELMTFEPSLLLASSSGQIINAHGSFGGQITDHESIISSKVDIEYSLTGDTHVIKHSAFAKKELNDSLTTYSVQFEMTPTEYADMALAIDCQTMISDGHVESTGKVTHGATVWDVQEILHYSNESENKDLNVYLAINCPAWEIDYLASQKVQIDSNVLQIESHVRIGLGKDYAISLIYSKVEDGHYKTQVTGTYEEESWIFDGTLMNKSVSGKINVAVDGSFKSSVYEIKISSGIYADNEKATADLKINFNSQDYTLMMEGTRTSILVNIHAIKHILVNAYVSEAEKAKKLHMSAEWDKDVNPTKAIVVDGLISPVEVLANVKFAEKEMSASGKILVNGVEMEAMWAPDKRILASVNYSLDDTKSLTATVETPFPGWEKQDATFAVSVKDYEITSRAAVTWKNTEQMSLAINGKLQPGPLNNAMKTEIIFSSNTESFERISFILDHNMAETNINTNINGQWNDNEMKGNFQVTPTENGVDASATFISPFTEEILVTLHHEFVDTALSTSLEAKYGAEVSTFTLMGQIETGEVQTSTLELKIITPTTIVPEIDGNIKYTYDGTHLALVTEGKVGEKKIMLNVNGEKIITEDSTAITGDLRFITPFTSPLTITLAHSYDGQRFTSESEISGIWITSGTVNMHAEGHIISREDIALTTSLITPDNNATLSLNHKIADSQITSAVDATVNEEHITMSVNGLLDTVNTLVNLQADMTSTLSGLEDITVNIESQRSENTWASKVTLVKDTVFVQIDHNINYIDILNWENSLIVNDIYKLRNKMTHADTAYAHELEYMWDSEAVHATGTIDPKISESSRQIHAQVIIGTSWTETIKVDLHHEDDGVEYKPTLRVEYKPGNTIEITTIIKFDTSFFYTESNLITPFWQPLGYKLNIDFQPQKAVTAVVIHGTNRTTVDVSGRWKEGKVGARTEIHSTYLVEPITFEAVYDIVSHKKMVHLAVSTYETYRLTGYFSGDMLAAMWSLDIELPFDAARHISFAGEYNVMTTPFSVNSIFMIDSRKYALNSTLNDNEFIFDIFMDRKKVNLSSNWSNQGTKANIEIKFLSHFNENSDININVKYDFQTMKNIHINFNDGAAELNFTGAFVDPLAYDMTANIITPFEGMQMLGGEAQLNMSSAIKTAEVKAYVNDVHYSWQLEAAAESPLKGYAISKIATPVTGWTALSVEGNFDFTAMPYKAVFVYDKEGVVNTYETQFSIDENTIAGEITTPIVGWEKIAMNGDYTYENNHLITNGEFLHGADSYQISADILFNNEPKLKVSIETPLADAANVDLILESNTDTERSLYATLTINDIIYSADVTSQLINKTGFVRVIISSPIPGYTTAEVYAQYDLTSGVKTADMDVKIEGEVQNFSVVARVNDNNVQLDILTPFEGFENVKMVGDYTVADNAHKVQVILETGDERFAFYVDFSFKNRSISLTLSTPIPIIQKVQVRGKLDIMNNGINCLLHIEKNENKVALGVKAIFTLLNSNLHLELETSADGLKMLTLDVKYDLISDIKSAEISLQKDELVKTIRVEACYKLEGGSFKIETPIEGFEVLGADYILRMDIENKTLDASVNIHLPLEDWIFSAHGLYDIENIKIELTTPFENLKLFSLAATYIWTESNKNVTVSMIYNENNYLLTGTLNTSARASDFTLQATTPFPYLENTSVMAKYDIDNKDELVAAYITVGEHVYNFLVAGYIEEKFANFKLDLTSPFSGWTNVKFAVIADFTNDKKMMEISLEKDENVKAIAISGKLIGSTIDFNLRTPITGLHNLGLFGSLDRAKRSIEFKMMSDKAKASLLTSFNSVKIQLKTPFEGAEEVSLEITKINDRTYRGKWRRNDNYVIISVEKDDTENTLSVDVQSELQGWEYLALAGILDEETLHGYYTGDITEERILISSLVKFGEVGKMDLHIQTPSEKYRTLDVDLDYDMTMLSTKLDILSSSNFHFLLECSPYEGIKSHLLVPNADQDTEVSVNLGIYSGEITFTSHFKMLKNFHSEYHIQTEPLLTVLSITKLNDEEILKLDFTGDIPNNKAHLQINARIDDHHTIIYYQQEGYSSVKFSIRNQGVSTDQEFRADAPETGSPAQGTLDDVFNNNFLNTLMTMNVRVELDTTQERKHLIVEFTPEPSKLYNLEMDFANSNEAGDINLRITTSDNMTSPWEHISGNWNLQDMEQAHIELTIGEIQYTVHGKLGMYESDLLLIPNNETENILLQWRIVIEENDYYIKVGQESNYALLNLKATFNDIANVIAEGGFKAGPFMANELLFTFQWNMGDDGIFRTEGTFIYGEYQGRHQLEEFSRNAETRSATFAWSATSNIPSFSSLSVVGNYDFNDKFVIYSLIKVEDLESNIDINLANLYPKYSLNTIELNIPGHPTVKFTLNHDFRDRTSRSISAIANIGETEQYIKVQWGHSAHYDVLNGNIEVKSIYIGDNHITVNYDISNAADNHLEAKYSGVVPDTAPKNLNIKWIRKRAQRHFENEIIIDSTFNLLPHARVYANIEETTENFHLSSGIEWNDNIIAFVLDKNSNETSAKLTTPFENLKSIEVSIEEQSTYRRAGKVKIIHLQYARGENKVDMELTINSKRIWEGSIELKLTTPFEELKYLHIKATWKDHAANFAIQRNDTQYNIEGKINLEVKRSSFRLSFKAPGWEKIQIAASYNLDNFNDRGSENLPLASLFLQFHDIIINFNLRGFHRRGRLQFVINGDTTFDRLRSLHITMNARRFSETFEVDFDVELNEIKFKISNRFEIMERNTFSVWIKLEGNRISHPIKFAFRRTDERYVVTLAYGHANEINLSLQGKDDFRTGFSGSLEIPNSRNERLSYDMSYGFESDNEYVISLDVLLGVEGQKIKVQFVYDSGVTARLTSPVTGEHSMRVRRSVTKEGFSAEAGIDDYNVKLRGDFKDEDTKRGALLEGDIFGNKFLIDFLFQSEGLQYSEGKLIIQTPFPRMENIGGIFTLSNADSGIVAHAEAFLPSNTKLVLKCNLAGTSLTEGYQGTVEIVTPFEAVPNLLVNVSIKMVEWTYLEAKLTINDSEITAEFTKAEDTFKFILDTFLATVHRQLSIEAKYPSLENIEGTLTVMLGEEAHKINGNFIIVSNRTQGIMELESNLVEGPRKLNFDISLPNASYDLITFDVSLTTSETYSLFLELDTTAGIIGTLKVDTPILPKINATIELAAAVASLTVETPEGIHKARVTWRLTSALPADWLVTLELASPLLTDDYTANIMISGERANMVLKAELQVGEIRHVVDGNIVMTEVGGELSLNIETPYKDINRLALVAALKFAEIIEMHITATHADDVNTLDMTYNTTERSVMALAKSPFIPSGQVSAQAQLTGNMGINMKFKMALNYGESTISGVLSVEFLSPYNINTSLKVTTPYKGYNVINFVARYVKDDITNILLSLDGPVKFLVEIHLSNSQDRIMADIRVETPTEKFEMVNAKITVPLNVFAPSVSVDVDLHNASYGANLGLRTKPPYELSLGYYDANKFNSKFHLRTDSSFFTVLS